MENSFENTPLMKEFISLEKKIKEDFDCIDSKEIEQKLFILKQRQQDESIYNDFEKLTKINIEINQLENKINPWLEIIHKLEESKELLSLYLIENESFSEEEISSELEQIKSQYQFLKTLLLFNNKEDNSNCYLTIQSGAGGTEACDWAMMLFRMYCRYAEKKFKLIVEEFHSGEEVGIKNATVFIEGNYAYGFMKAEMGVHRLVRISPFDAAKKRHTSFASITVSPEIKNDSEIIINPTDLKIDTFRASGAGGQHVNTTDSAVRITHIPSGIVVSCQAQRSQHQNKERAIKMLKSKLYDLELQEKRKQAAEKQAEKKKIEWGSQIRSYIFHPYQMVKDHRTDLQINDIKKVMDGEIENFILEWLKKN